MGPSVPSSGDILYPTVGDLETFGLAPKGYEVVDSSISTEVVETILSARAPSTRKRYALNWQCFVLWFEHHLNPVHCPVGTMLEYAFLSAWLQPL